MHLPLLLAASGAAAGLIAQCVLARLNRGAVVHKGWCALAVALLWSLAGWRTTTGHLPWWWLPIPLAAAWFAVTLTAVDVKHHRLPNALTMATYPITAAVTILAATQSSWHLTESALAGAAALTLTYAAIHLISPAAMGAGDVKLSGSQGAIMGAVGWPAVLVGTTLAALLTLATAAVTPRQRRQGKLTVPHGPALLTATYLVATFPTITAPG